MNTRINAWTYGYIGEKMKTMKNLLSGKIHGFIYLSLQIEEFRLHWYLEIILSYSFSYHHM